MTSRRVVGIVDYQAGNIRSLENALEHLGAQTIRLAAAEDFAQCSHVLLPGVGAFGFCAQRLAASGLLPALHEWAFEYHKPLLGICVGMQLMAAGSEEDPGEAGLDWIGGTVRKLVAGTGIRVPHVGWNRVTFTESLGEFPPGDSADFYFDHSYAYQSPVRGHATGLCAHGIKFCAVVRRENVIAAQFHPEKSQEAGLRFLRGFLSQ